MVLPPRSILRSNTQSTTNTTKRVTWADQPFHTHVFDRRPPPSVLPRAPLPTTTPTRPHTRQRPQRHTCRKHQNAEKEARRRRRADGVVKRRTGVELRRLDVNNNKKKKNKSFGTESKKKRKCKRGLVYAREYVTAKCLIKDAGVLDYVDSKNMFKIYVNVRRRLGKRVDQSLRKRMIEDENRMLQDRKIVRRQRRNLESFVNKTLPGVRAEAFSSSQLCRVAVAAVIHKFERVHRQKRSSLR